MYPSNKLLIRIIFTYKIICYLIELNLWWFDQDSFNITINCGFRKIQHMLVILNQQNPRLISNPVTDIQSN